MFIAGYGFRSGVFDLHECYTSICFTIKNRVKRKLEWVLKEKDRGTGKGVRGEVKREPRIEVNLCFHPGAQVSSCGLSFVGKKLIVKSSWKSLN